MSSSRANERRRIIFWGMISISLIVVLVGYFSTPSETPIRVMTEMQVENTDMLYYESNIQGQQEIKPQYVTSSHEQSLLRIENLFEKNNKSKSSEVWISDIYIDGQRLNWNDLQKQGLWEIRDNGNSMVSFQKTEGTSSIVELHLNKASKLKIQFISHDWSGKVRISIGDEVQVVDLYNPSLATYTFNKIFDQPTTAKYEFDLMPNRNLKSLNISSNDQNANLKIFNYTIESEGKLTKYDGALLPKNNSHSISIPVSAAYPTISLKELLLISLVSIIGLLAVIRKRKAAYVDISRLGRTVNYILTYVLLCCFIFLIYLSFLQISKVPYLSDDYSNLVNFKGDINYSDPAYARGVIWIFILSKILIYGNPAIDHIINLCVHLLNAILMIIIGKNLFKSSSSYSYLFLFLLLLMLFTNSLNNENTLWITAGYSMYVMLFGLLASYMMIFYIKSSKKVMLVLFYIASIGAYFINEQGFLFLPFYIFTYVVYKDQIFNFKSIAANLKKILLLSLTWIIPYVLFRAILLLGYKQTSAAVYQSNFSLSSVLHSYLLLGRWLYNELVRSYIPVILLFVIVLMVLTIMADKKHRIKMWGKYQVFPWSVLFVLVLLIPFSLLSGWIEHRFFYLASSFVLFFMFIFFKYVFKDLLDVFNLRRKSSEILSYILVLSLILTTFSQTQHYVANTLKLTDNLASYVDSFISEQNEQYERIPNQSVIFIDVQNPPYRTPDDLFISNTIKQAWVPPAMVTRGFIKNENDVYLLSSHYVEGNKVYTPYASWFIEKDVLHSIATNNRRVYLFTYDGLRLIPEGKSQLIFMENNDRVESFDINPAT